MLAIFLKTLPFFALIGLGWGAGRLRFFPDAATEYLTRFVFYFALSAMLFRFAANLSLAEIFDARFAAAYLAGCLAVYLLATLVARLRRIPATEAAVEAQCAVIGNTGFLGVPLLTVLLGPEAAGPILMVLAIDLIVFSSLITLIITGAREGHLSPRIIKVLAFGLVKNPMIVSMAAGLAVSSAGLSLPAPVEEFMTILGAAATPCALFAIGASLASKTAERLSVALWLSFAKLVLHPVAVAVAALLVFGVEPFAAGVMIAAASLPVAGNVYILARTYGVAPQRVSASILISTVFSIVTVSLVVAWITAA
ncbi:MAG: AEC family transporter [Rhodobacteraceae bacterium]|uniref:AEC family transporter n=1 Tax=Albidovulum sp. TaxID=1872424 RepID=UPI001D6DC455|nr:AEC family transporter [Paracoccaceae bacterium]HPE25527.1 AEC family transporter [Albidovulum sp.]MCB2130925.1 AEC family transporter [Paracoccaceae bacterium]MCB2143412.1 AEC family transporter [Paracoccaceae bacterium]MCB2151741.1 AEC family transporter [Paracoccaceae bacterium]